MAMSIELCPLFPTGVRSSCVAAKLGRPNCFFSSPIPVLACSRLRQRDKLNAEFRASFGVIRMASAVKTEHPHVVRLEGVCGGEPVIDGLRVTVRHVATLHRRGETILEIAEALGISEPRSSTR